MEQADFLGGETKDNGAGTFNKLLGGVLRRTESGCRHGCRQDDWLDVATEHRLILRPRYLGIRTYEYFLAIQVKCNNGSQGSAG